MPVSRFKTFEEAERALWCFNPDKAYFERVSKLFKMAKSIPGRKVKRGITRYRTIEEAQSD